MIHKKKILPLMVVDNPYKCTLQKDFVVTGDMIDDITPVTLTVVALSDSDTILNDLNKTETIEFLNNYFYSTVNFKIIDIAKALSNENKATGVLIAQSENRYFLFFMPFFEEINYTDSNNIDWVINTSFMNFVYDNHHYHIAEQLPDFSSEPANQANQPVFVINSVDTPSIVEKINELNSTNKTQLNILCYNKVCYSTKTEAPLKSYGKLNKIDAEFFSRFKFSNVGMSNMLVVYYNDLSELTLDCRYIRFFGFATYPDEEGSIYINPPKCLNGYNLQYFTGASTTIDKKLYIDKVPHYIVVEYNADDNSLEYIDNKKYFNIAIRIKGIIQACFKISDLFFKQSLLNNFCVSSFEGLTIAPLDLIISDPKIMQLTVKKYFEGNITETLNMTLEEFFNYKIDSDMIVEIES